MADLADNNNNSKIDLITENGDTSSQIKYTFPNGEEIVEKIPVFAEYFDVTKK